MCPTPPGGHLEPRNWRSRAFARARKQAAFVEDDIKPARPYDSRHVFASLLIHAGESASYVAGHMGHLSPTTTNDHYAHEFARRALNLPRDPTEAIRAVRQIVLNKALPAGFVLITCPSGPQPGCGWSPSAGGRGL